MAAVSVKRSIISSSRTVWAFGSCAPTFTSYYTRQLVIHSFSALFYLVPVVLKVDVVIHLINHFPVHTLDTYLLDIDVSVRQ